MKTETTKKAGRVRVTAKAVTTPELYSYLKRHRLCKKYLRNLLAEEPTTAEDLKNGYLGHYGTIGSSFIYANTPEGHEFWRLHSDKAHYGRHKG